MPVVAPFRGIRYNPAKVKDLNDVVTQPYDKITPSMQDAYYRRSDFNFVRLILNRDPQPYASSKATLDQWLSTGVLIKDRLPAVYPYRQVFSINGRRRIRRGLTCLVRLEELGSGAVLPHERTLSKPKEDRLNLMRATGMQFEHVFMLYSDEKDRLNKLLAPIWKWTPDIDVVDEYGTTHCLWSVTDTRTIRTIQALLRGKIFVIADGHHRYETALRYRSEVLQQLQNSTGREALNYRLVTCVNLNDPSLVILPTHRLVRSIPDFSPHQLIARSQPLFLTRNLDRSHFGQVVTSAIARRSSPGHHFFFYAGQDACYELALRDGVRLDDYFTPDHSADYRELDVAILHAVIIEHLLGIAPESIENHVSYERDWKRAIEQVDQGNAQCALIVNPTRAEQVLRIAENRELMPQKSTDFFPKLMSGLVFLDVGPTEMIEE